MRKRKYAALCAFSTLDSLTQEITDYAHRQFKNEFQLDLQTCNQMLINHSEKQNASAQTDMPRDTSTPRAQIHNIVGTSKISTQFEVFDLDVISRLLPNCTYDCQKFAAITIRLHDPYCTVLLFTSGKMVLTGCRSFVECCWASQNVVNILRFSLPQYAFHVTEVTIQNIVGNVDLVLGTSHKINLERMYAHESVFCTFQKNMFPGLIYRANKSPVVLLLFHSGKVVITGGKSVNDITEGWNLLWPQVRQYIEPL